MSRAAAAGKPPSVSMNGSKAQMQMQSSATTLQQRPSVFSDRDADLVSCMGQRDAHLSARSSYRSN